MRYNNCQYGGPKYETPIFITDRTMADVEQRTDKAYLNAHDLVRIEYRTGEIRDMFHSIGYDMVVVKVWPMWMRDSLLYYSGMERIRNNIEVLIETYNHNIGQPEILYSLRPDVFDINALEASLELLDYHIKRVAHQWQQRSGTTIAGGGIL